MGFFKRGIKRDFGGRFAVRMTRTRKAALWGIGILIAMAAYGALGDAYVGGYLQNEVSYIAAPRAEAAEIVPDRIEDAKWKVIDMLQACEGAGHGWDEGFIKLDTNDKLSYGPLQFQKATVVGYVHDLWGKDVSGLEAVQIALDQAQARKLAYDIIFKTKNGVANDWVNCSKWYGLQTRVDFIKEIGE